MTKEARPLPPLGGDEQQVVVFSRSAWFDLWVLVLSFFCAFVSYGSLINLATPLFGDRGGIAFATIYITWIFCSPFVSSVLNLLGSRKSLIIALALYVPVTVAFFLFDPEPVLVDTIDGVERIEHLPTSLQSGFLIFAGVLVGIGAGGVWSGQGQYLTLCAQDHALESNPPKPMDSFLGVFNGIFWGCFQLTQIVGNAISSAVLRSDSDPETLKPTPRAVHRLASIMFGFAVVGVLGSFLLQDRRVVETQDFDDEAGEKKPVTKEEVVTKPSRLASTRREVQLSMSMFKNKHFLLLMPAFFHNGVEVVFIVGTFTRYAIANTVGESNVGMVMIFYGVGNAGGSFLLGKLSDVIGKVPSMLLGLGSQIVAVILLLSSKSISGQQHLAQHHYSEALSSEEIGGLMVLLILCAILLGIGDAAINTVLSADVGETFKGRETAAAFSTYRMVLSIACSTYLYSESFLGDWFSFEAKSIIMSLSCSLAAVFYIIHRFELKTKPPS